MKLKLAWASDNSDYKGRRSWFIDEITKQDGFMTDEQRYEDIIIEFKSLADLMYFIRWQG